MKKIRPVSSRASGFHPIRLLVALLLLISSLLLAAPAGRADSNFSIDFNNVRLENFIQTMGRLLNQNFALAPGVSGSITIYSSRPIPVKEAESVFYAVLNLYGFTAVPDPAGNVTKILPLAEARGRPLEVFAGRDPEQLVPFGDRYVTQIVPLSYAAPDALLPILNPFISKNANLSAETKTGVLIITDAASNIRKLLSIIDQVDREAPAGKDTLHIYRLQNANAQEVAQVLTAVLAQKQARTPIRPGDKTVFVSVVAAAASNSLLITASPEDYASLEKVITELDKMPGQVMIEALVAEVSGDLMREFGIQWQYFEPEAGKYRGFGSYGGVIDSATLSNIANGIAPPGLLVGLVKGNEFPFNIGALVRLYGKDSNFKILSTPQITTMDNKEAQIKVAETIPYSKQITYSVTSEQIPTQSFDYQDVGITLKITPHISESRQVRLDIEQEVTKLVSYLSSGGTSGSATILAPTIAKRTAKSSLIVSDQSTMVLGGLIRDDTDETVQKVPGLANLPLLGHLFRHQVKQNVQTSLYIFITPRIITNREEAETIADEKQAILEKPVRNR
ncbi:MAG TPA: secretin N-terminal domain-containing protein [bacterium]|nr:secretin N-terminal domain-containing protein [bacterium]HNS48607.1 secretin N-terminal domain-containing protein [bacterium]